jgi:hypothetical protein
MSNMEIQMTSATIAMVIKYFNITLIIVLAVFAVLWVIPISRKKIREKIFFSAFCAAVLAAFVLEATAFNFLHYQKYFAGPAVAIAGTSETNPNILLTTDGTGAEFTENGIHFNNLNRKVTSIFVDIDFNEIETMEMLVKWTDEGITQQYVKTLYKYLPHENYAPLQPCGKVSELTVLFGGHANIIDIVINKPIPFYFSGLRLLVVSALLFAVFAVLNRTVRAKAAYYLFEYKFDPKNIRQNIIYASTVALLILFSWVCVYTSFADVHVKNDAVSSQYNKYLVDALIAGRTYLDYGHPESLLDAERPYDNSWRESKGTVGRHNMESEAWDWVWYKGKYYCYFGVVPAVLLYIPYKVITGNYLSNHAGIFVFCAIAVILLAVLWRYCAKKYMRDTIYVFYWCSFVTLFFTSGLFVTLRYVGTWYSIVQSAGFMFNIAGILLLLKSVDNEKINYARLFFACLCLAFVFGCRPNMGLASILVPIVLWRHKTWKLFVFAMLPYIIVAIPLCLYNYMRFESIFEFGMNYQLTNVNHHAYFQQNILTQIFKMFKSSVDYLFYPIKFSPYFPYIEAHIGYSLRLNLGALWDNCNPLGMINFPVTLLLFYIFKNILGKDKPNIFYVLFSALVIAAVIIIMNSVYASVCSARYILDFSIFIILPSLFCAYYWFAMPTTQHNTTQHNTAIVHRLSVIYALMAASIFAGLFLCVTGTGSTYSNPTLYRYLERSLSLF